MKPEQTRCGYVALVGRPNVGKSTLMNHLLKQKLAITSRKPQTTRKTMLGVDTDDNSQAIYVDTPGIHEPGDREINKLMVKEATSVFQDVDLLVLLVEHNKWTAEDQVVADRIAASGVPGIAVMNKVDQLRDKTLLLPAIAKLQQLELFKEIIPISALRGEGLDALRSEIFKRLPEAEHEFPADQITDQTERRLVAEIVREKLMRRLGDEIPHRCAVVVEGFHQGDNGVDIDADIYVERTGQKRIVIGKGGEKLRQIGEEARHDIETLLDQKVMLRLWVKVKSGWTNDPMTLKRMGYD